MPDVDSLALFSLAALALLLIPGRLLATDGAYAVAAGSVSGFLRRRRRALRYSSGSVLVGLDAVTAAAGRSG